MAWKIMRCQTMSVVWFLLLFMGSRTASSNLVDTLTYSSNNAGQDTANIAAVLNRMLQVILYVNSTIFYTKFISMINV